VVNREIRGQIRFFSSSRKDESLRDMSGSGGVRLVGLFAFSVVAWAYVLGKFEAEIEVAFTDVG